MKKHDFYLNKSQEYEIGYVKQQYRRFYELYEEIERINTKNQYKNSRVLDIGTTPFTIYLQKMSTHKIFTVDYTDNFKYRCEEANIDFIKHDITTNELPYPENHFDIILFTEVFEHLIANPVRIFKKIYAMLKPNGYMLFGTPNLANLQKRIKLMFNKPILDSPTYELEAHNIHGHGHNRIYLLEEVKDYILDAGFIIDKIRYSKALDHVDIFDDTFQRIAKRVLMLPKIILPSLRWGIHIIAKK